MHLAGPRAVAEGAALFALRQRRGWATYMDQLPQVRLVVRREGEPAWKEIFEGRHYDAGKPHHNQLGGFSVVGGERTLKLAASVEGFGTVRETCLEFDELTSSDVDVVVDVEIQAASGLPVVTATVQQAGVGSAILHWDTATDTGLGESDYLHRLPKAYPPLECRVVGAWWVKHERRRRVFFASQYRVGEEMAELLVTGVVHRRLDLESYLAELLKLARVRVFDRESRVWTAATDLDGSNPDSPTMEALQSKLLEIVEREPDSRLAERSARILAWLHCTVDSFVLQALARVERAVTMPENSPWILALGECLRDREKLSKGVGLLAAILHRRVKEQSVGAPRGMRTLHALGSVFAMRAEATADLSDGQAEVLADDIAEFLRRTVEYGRGLNQKFRIALRAFVFLLRRRVHSPGFLPAGSPAFERVARVCAFVYIALQLKRRALLERRLGHEERICNAKSDARHLRRSDGASVAPATIAMQRIIDGLDPDEWPRGREIDAKGVDALQDLLVQVIYYLEGRGSGLLVFDHDEEEDESDD